MERENDLKSSGMKKGPEELIPTPSRMDTLLDEHSRRVGI
jgi:hypothetical protein